VKRLLPCLTALAILVSACEAQTLAEPGRFTPLVPLGKPAIVDSATAYPGGAYDASNLVDGIADGSHRSEYASAGKGTETFVVFDFGKPTAIAAFKHVDRFDPATVDRARLIFSDDADFARTIATIEVKHANSRGGVTFVPFEPVAARFVRWQVTAVHSYGTVGGAEIDFYAAAEREPLPTQIAIEPAGFSALVEAEGKTLQPFRVTLRYPYAEPTEAVLELPGAEPQTIELRPGSRSYEFSAPAVERPTPMQIAVTVAGTKVASVEQVLRPVRPWVLYFLPHSHVDIGYTHVQSEVERMQWAHFEQAIDLARRTADYPAEARFKWNSEVLWAVDSYLKQAPADRREAFVDAVRKGWIHLDGLYGNELTALCRPEELFRLLDCARRITREHGLAIDAAMISDVPGYTWGIVPALAHGGIRYFSIGPNHVHRIGYTLADWGDRAFYWKSPSGRERVLCWMAGKAYSWFHGGRMGDVEKADPKAIFEYLAELCESGYPYDMVQIRYSIGGDNGPPDPNLPEFVKAWNAKYRHPKLVIATTREMFREFERRYGDRIPEVRGDFTPYWEDGAGSSARETALTRTASERLVQAEALWAMLRPGEYPVDDFYAAWRSAILYNEHTWGAHCSISQPDSQFTLDQWKIKQAFALEAERQSKELMEAAVAGIRSDGDTVAAIDVFNTCSWPRTDLLVLPPGMSPAGEAITDAGGSPVPSQRLSTGELAIVVADVPPLGAKRLAFGPGDASPSGAATAEGTSLTNGRLRVAIDETSGAIVRLGADGVSANLVSLDAGPGLNDYFYVPGRDPKTAVRNGKVKIAVQDPGPLVASLRIEGDAPGCRKLTRTVRVVDGLDRVDLVNVVDKEPIRDKESVHFGFAFDVPDGVVRMNTPWAVVRPEVDQFPGACKNYLTVGRWVDVSNGDVGVTWTTLDAPLIELDAITVDVANPFDPGAWIRHVDPSGTFYSYVMNNYWETNYKADQEGPTTFRYAIRPHGRFDSAAASRFAIEQSQPLVAVPVAKGAPLPRPLLRVEPARVIATLVKPSDDGKAYVVRLFNAGDKPAKASVSWPGGASSRWSVSSPGEEAGPESTGPIELPPMGIVTLRAEMRRSH